jgi:hypothetical protein
MKKTQNLGFNVVLDIVANHIIVFEEVVNKELEVVLEDKVYP